MLSALILLASKAVDKLEQKEPIFSVVLSKKLSLLLSNLKERPGGGVFMAAFSMFSACFQHAFSMLSACFQHVFSTFQHA